MMNDDFDPYEMLMELQQQVLQIHHAMSTLHANQEKLIAALNHQGTALTAINQSNQRNFEFILEQSMKLDGLILKIQAEQHKKSA
jgi:hypothetical protein